MISGRHSGQRLERLQLGGEHDAPVLPSPIERLDAEPVAHQAEPALLAVEHGEGEHADQALDGRAHAPCGDRLDDDLRIGVAPEAAAERFKLGPELRRAIDLAVIGDDIAAAGRRHGLRAGGRKIDDGKPRMAEGDARVGIDEHAARIGAAMGELRRHGLGDRFERLRP